MSPSRTKTIVRPSAEKSGSVSAGSLGELVEVPVLGRVEAAFERLDRAGDGFLRLSVTCSREDDGAGRAGARRRAAGTARARSASSAMRVSRSKHWTPLSGRLRCPTDARAPDRTRQRQPASPPGHSWPDGSHAPRCSSAARLSAAVEAELDHAGGDQARAVAAGVAGDVELGGERVEAALGGALADVERLGDLGAGGGTAGEGALAAVGRDQRRRRRPLLLAEGHRGSLAATVRPARPGTGSETSSRWPPTISVSPSRSRRGRSSGSPLSAVPLRLSRSVAISTPPRLSISRWFQETASSSM